MPHARKQIRDAVITAVTGLTTTGSTVFASRVYPMDAAQLPGLIVFTKDQSSELVTMGNPATLGNTLEVVIEAYVKATAAVDDTIDTILSEVETAIKDASALQSLVKWIYPEELEIVFQGEGDQKVAVAVVTFQAFYHTREGAPETIV